VAERPVALPPNKRGDGVMSQVSKGFRDQAARMLRAARNAPGGSERESLLHVAKSYKALAHDEEWLRGEPQKSLRRPRKN
jgi:hypothetical protein